MIDLPALLDTPISSQLTQGDAALIIRLRNAVRELARERDHWSEQTEKWREEAGRYYSALVHISEIRDSIVGMQGFNFSEHAYPLVAVLNGVGIKGAGYEIARKNLGTLIEQRNEAEAQRDSAQARVGELEAELDRQRALVGEVIDHHFDTCECKHEDTCRNRILEIRDRHDATATKEPK